MPRRRILLPWTQQPTEYGGLDETNLFAGLTSAFYTPRLEITRGLLMLGEAGAPLDVADQPGEVVQIATSGGSTSAREFLSSPIDLTGPYSVAIRLRRLGTSSASYDRIAHANGSNTGANRCGFLMTSNSDGNPNRIYWLQSDGSSNLVQTYSPNWPAVSTASYDTCVVVANGATLQMYVNGVAYNTFACTTFPGVMANPFRFGTDGAGANGAPVNVEFVHFMRGALTADQVREYTDNPWQIFEPQAIWATVSSGGGATDYPVTVSESASAADASSVVIGYARSAAEAGSAADSVASSAAQSGSVAESSSAADVVSGSAAGDYAGTLAESASAADAQSQATAKSGTLAESVTALDAASAGFAATVTISEAGSAADSGSVVASLGKAIAEAGSAVDATSGTTTGDYAGTVAEAGSAADVASVVAALTAARAETMSAADTISVVRAIAVALVDSLAPVDAASSSATGDYTAAAAEALNAMDTTSVQAAMTRSVAEVATAADAQYLLQQWVAAIAEVASAADLSGAALNAVVAQSLWWTYAVLAQDVRFAVPPTDINFEAAPASLAYRIER